MKQVSTKKPAGVPSAAKIRVSNKGQGQDAAQARRKTEWWIAAVVVLLLACLLRLLFLDLKPLHHDEGVNGFFMTNLFRAGSYHYDPANYHGPALYYFGLITTTLNALFYGKEGLSTFAIRLVPALFGIAMVCVVLSLRRYLGAFGALAAALLLAVSPGMVFFSRYFIHEILFVFFTLTLAASAWRYRETGRQRYLMFACASAALMFTTKETCIISFAVLALAWLCTWLYLRIVKRPDVFPAPSPQAAEVTARATTADRLYRAGLAALLFVAISVLFYSSFFTNFPKGVVDSLNTFQIWTHTGIHTDQYRAPFLRYLDWLRQEELPILALGALGIVVALTKERNGFAIFAAFWGLGITGAYSLVPYKTPWLVLNLVLPLAISGGYALNEWNGPGRWRRISLGLVLLAAVGFSLYQTIDLNFYRYDNDSIPYVYAHTSREFLGLVEEVESIAGRSPAGRNTGMTILADVYWPLPWYLRNYPNAGFWGRMASTSELRVLQPILIASGPQTEAVEKQFGSAYRLYRTYQLRPGNDLVLFLRRDVQP